MNDRIFEQLVAALSIPSWDKPPVKEIDMKIGDLIEVYDNSTEEAHIGILVDKCTTHGGDGGGIIILKLKTPEGDLVVTHKGNGFGRLVRKL